MVSKDVRLNQLKYPDQPVDIFIDADAKNEIDDQYAIAYALISREEINVEAIAAAPFWHPEFLAKMSGYATPEIGMEASYQEILTVLEKMDLQIPTYKGSRSIMTAPDESVRSDAADKLIHLALQDRKQPLYVIATGALTNVASSVLLEPEITERIVVVWLGGHLPFWYTIRNPQMLGDFNAWVDPIAAMALYDSGVPIVWIPCKNVAEHLRTTPCEIYTYVKGRGHIGNYLAELLENTSNIPYLRYIFYRALKTLDARSWVFWDMTNIAYLINPEWMPTKLLPTPKLQINNLESSELTPNSHTLTFDDLIWCEAESNRPLCRVAIHVERDPIFRDFYLKLEKTSNT